MKNKSVINIPRTEAKRMRQAVLQVLKDSGGRAKLADISPKVYKILKLTDEEINYQYPNQPGRHVAFHRLQVAMQVLKQKREIRLTNGTWCIADSSDQTSANKSTVVGNNAQRLLDHLQNNLDDQGLELEAIIKRWLELQGYKDVETTRRAKDGGIDLRAKIKVHGGLGTLIIQAKNYGKKPIDVKEIRAIRGLAGGANDYAWFITTSKFTRDARNEAKATDKFKGVELTDGLALVKQLIKSDIELKYVYPDK